MLFSCSDDEGALDPCPSSVFQQYEGVKFSVVYFDENIPEDSFNITFPEDI